MDNSQAASEASTSRRINLHMWVLCSYLLLFACLICYGLTDASRGEADRRSLRYRVFELEALDDHVAKLRFHELVFTARLINVKGRLKPVPSTTYSVGVTDSGKVSMCANTGEPPCYDLDPMSAKGLIAWVRVEPSAKEKEEALRFSN